MDLVYCKTGKFERNKSNKFEQDSENNIDAIVNFLNIYAKEWDLKELELSLMGFADLISKPSNSDSFSLLEWENINNYLAKGRAIWVAKQIKLRESNIRFIIKEKNIKSCDKSFYNMDERCVEVKVL